MKSCSVSDRQLLFLVNAAEAIYYGMCTCNSSFNADYNEQTMKLTKTFTEFKKWSNIYAIRC